MNGNGWEEKASRKLEAAKSLLRLEDHPEVVCELAEDSAKYGLTAYLLGVGAGLPKDFRNCDLIYLGAEVRAEEGELSKELQEAIWRLSAYHDLPAQSSIHPARRTSLSTNGPEQVLKDDAKQALIDEAKQALKDANTVVNFGKKVGEAKH